MRCGTLPTSQLTARRQSLFRMLKIMDLISRTKLLKTPAILRDGHTS